jgi:peptide/nickel transport system substrate-binding protein
VSFNPGVELVLEAFEGYWRKTPSIKHLVFRSPPDETTRAAALKSGEVDVAFLLSGHTADDIRRTQGLRLVAPLVPATCAAPGLAILPALSRSCDGRPREPPGPGPGG